MYYYTYCKYCGITAVIKRCNSIIKKKRKKHDKIVLLTKNKLSTIEVYFFKAIVDSNINHDKFATVKAALKEYNDMKEAVKNLNNK